jgi:hypothetical protein
LAVSGLTAILISLTLGFGCLSLPYCGVGFACPAFSSFLERKEWSIQQQQTIQL